MLEARSLTKYYEHTAAVRGVSFTIRPGEILGYLGPNGAGKSTTVKMLTGLLEPSQGQIFYQGRSVHEDFTAFQRRIGYVPEEAHLYPHLTGREYLQLCGRLRGMPRRALEPKMDEFLRAFSLWDDRHSPLSSYSKGMRQKILLSAALLHDPDILILDEPFSGLDVTSALMLRTLLRSLASRGKIVLYSSHVLEVVEKVCSQVLILRKGEVAAYDSIERLRELMQQPSLEGVFAQLAQVDDGEEVANRIVEAMSSAPEMRVPAPPVAAGLRIYRGLANAFPHEFQNVYGPELTAAGEDAIEPVWRRYGMLGVARLLLDLAVHVPVEYAAECVKDVRYAFRRLIGSPGFTAVALISLALGICIVTSAFSEMNGIALRDLPGAAAAQQLVTLDTPASYPDYRRYSARDDLFASTFAYIAAVPFGVTLGGHTAREWGQLITPSYFATLGVDPAMGRFPDDREAATSPVVVSYRFWQERLAADPGVIGRGMRVNGQPATIVAVCPRGFLGASPLLFAADLWLPLSVGEQVAPELAGHALEDRGRRILRVVGRLRAGVSMARAESALDVTARQIERDAGDPGRDRPGRRIALAEGGKLLPLRNQDLPFFTSFFLVVSGLVMLIACANVANLMLARAAGRRKEIALRLALGASRTRIVRQLLTESMMIALGAAVPGILLSVWLVHLLTGVKAPLPIPVTFDFHADWRVLLGATGFTALTALIFGLLPAWQASKVDLASGMRPARRWKLRNVLMISQFAGSLTLLVILGLLSVGIQTTLGIQAGFQPRDLFLLSLDPVRDGFSGERTTQFFDKLLDRVQGLRAVNAACLTDTVPVSVGSARMRVSTPGGSGRQVITALRHVVGKDYFATAGIPVPIGRAFRRDDERNRTPSVIVSQEFAREFPQGGDLLGRQIEIGNDEIAGDRVLPGTFDYRQSASGSRGTSFVVVGIAGDVAEGMVVQKPLPVVYFPLRQVDYAAPPAQGITLMVRSAPGADGIEAVRREIAVIDSDIEPFNLRTMDEQIDRFMAMLRAASWTYRVVGIFGLLLSAVGLAGMTAYSVAQRTREIGIRMALGARRGNVLAVVMREGLLLVAVGTAVGMAAAWAGSRGLAFMNSTVGRVTTGSASEPVVLVGAPILLACLAILACYVPALQSMRIDPVVALREE